MPFALNFYHDQVGAGGATSSALAPAHRLLYVRHGCVEINGQVLSADAAIYCDGAVTLKSAGEWSQVWRWELAPPNAAPLLHDGEGVLSALACRGSSPPWPCPKAPVGCSASTKSPPPPAASPIAISIQDPASAACLRARSTSSRTPSRAAIWRRVRRGGRPARTPWSPGVRGRWRQSFCAAWCCRSNGKAGDGHLALGPQGAVGHVKTLPRPGDYPLSGRWRRTGKARNISPK
jgi:hypothetical protein